MPELQYAVVKYVSDSIAFEPVNIGIAAVGSAQPEIFTRLTRSWSRVRTKLGVPVRPTALQTVWSAIEKSLQDAASLQEWCNTVEETFRGSVFAAGPFVSVAVEQAEELDLLYRRFVTLDNPTRERSRVTTVATVRSGTRKLMAERAIPFAESRTVVTGPVKIELDFVTKTPVPHLVKCFSLDTEPERAQEHVELFVHRMEHLRDSDHQLRRAAGAAVAKTAPENQALNDYAEDELKRVDFSFDSFDSGLQALMTRIGAGQTLD